MASMIVDMALPAVTGTSLLGSVPVPLADPTGFAALLAPAPAAMAPSAPLALPKGIDMAIVSALIPTAPIASPAAAPVFAEKAKPATTAKSATAAPIAPTILPDEDGIVAEPASTPTAPAPPLRKSVSDTPITPDDTNDAPVEHSMAAPVPAHPLPEGKTAVPTVTALGNKRETTIGTSTAGPVTTPIPASPGEVAATPPTEPATKAPATATRQRETGAPKNAQPSPPPAPTASPLAGPKAPRLARTLALTTALPDNTAPAPEAAALVPISAAIRAEPAPERGSERRIEEADEPVQPAPAEPLPAGAPIAMMEPAPRIEPKPGVGTEPVAAPMTAAPVETPVAATAAMPVASNASAPTRDSPAGRETSTSVSPAIVDSAPAEPAISTPSPAFGELIAAKPVTTPHRPATEHPTPVSAHPERIAPETAVAISRHLATGGAETITIRLDPVDMGRIEVRLSFDEGGALRGVIAADNPAALDLLRRDQAGLVASLSDAGVATDAQSFRFDTRSDDRGGQRQWTQRQPDAPHYRADAPTDEPQTEDYRPLMSRGRVDVMA